MSVSDPSIPVDAYVWFDAIYYPFELNEVIVTKTKLPLISHIKSRLLYALLNFISYSSS